MPDSVQKPTTDELLEYIAQLEARIEKQASELSKRTQQLAFIAKNLDAALVAITDNTDDIYERLMAVEDHLFPGIVRDIKQAARITGAGDDRDTNPLDRRPG